MTGYAIKKVMKIAAVVIGLFVAALAYLSYRGWVDVKWAVMGDAPVMRKPIHTDKLQNSTTNLNGYAHFVVFADYENNTSYFHDFKLLELSTNSSNLTGKPAYMLIGTYQNPSTGSQKLMEIGTIIGDKAYVIQYIADAPNYSDHLPTVQNMINSLVIKNTMSDHAKKSLNR